MKIQQLLFYNQTWTTQQSSKGFDKLHCNLVLAFGDAELVTVPDLFEYLQQNFPNAQIVINSTAGEILHETVYDHSVVVTAIQLDKSRIAAVESNINQHHDSRRIGFAHFQQLREDDLKSIFIVSDGTYINGSDLVSGFNECNDKKIPITGGLAGDAARFTKTFVGLNKIPAPGNVVSIGFYGDDLEIGHGTFSGWDEFGPYRTITKSDKNILYEIDGNNALDLYKSYLGPYSEELPGSALLFPLSVEAPEHEEPVVRTILNINEEQKTMTFAGNLPVGSKVRLMKANFDRIIDGSSEVAFLIKNKLKKHPELSIFISCVGRKLVLQERTEEEIQAAQELFGTATAVTGFYSYGEISPLLKDFQCGLHNQTITITTFSEI